MSARSRKNSKVVPLSQTPVASAATSGLVSPNTPVQSAPPSPTAAIPTLEISNPQGVIRDPGVEEELLRYGYVPREKLVVRCGGNLECPYIKAINKNGQTVFVELDKTGIVAMEGGNLVTIESRDANIVPYSAKIGEMECAKLDVCGLAFECKDGVCVLTRQDQSTSPIERNFVVVERNLLCNRIATFENSPISYPLVRLSEIRQNPDCVLKLVDECTKRLRNVAYSNALQEYAKTVCQLNELTNAVNALIITNTAADKKLKDSIMTLENWNYHYHMNPPATVECKEMLRRVQVNLRIRNNMVVDLLNVANTFNSRRDAIKRLTDEVVDMNRYLTEKFCSIDYVLDA